MSFNFPELSALDNNLLDLTLSLGPGPAYAKPQFPSSTANALVFDYSIQLVGPATETSGIDAQAASAFVKLSVNNDGDLRVVAPREIRNRVDETAFRHVPKRRRLKLRNSDLHVTIAMISRSQLNEVIVQDAVLCSSLQGTNIPMIDSRGPYIKREGSGSVVLCFGLALVPDRVITSRSHQTLMLRFLSRALNDPSLENPLEYQAHPLDLLRVITRTPSEAVKIPEIHVNGLRTQLLPYQRETVNWCLRREGKEMSSESSVRDLDVAVRDYVVSPPLGWRQIPDSSVWVNPYLLITSSEPRISHHSPNVEYKGRGILAEEMGLGKTLEMISLMLLNQRLASPKPDPEQTMASSSLPKSKATVVIVPRTILHQWVSELKLHAPHLSVLLLTSPNPALEDLLTADVVLVTYAQLSRWLPHTATRRKREARNTRPTFAVEHLEGEDDDEAYTSKYTSTLVAVEFWRVILDEVQMVHTGSSAAAQVARRIPRVHAWAASGTPVKHSLEDLRGITYFLDLVPFVERPCWQRLISSPVDFTQTMSLIAIRHTKHMVADQLFIPKQHRRLLLLKFSAVERARYSRLYSEFLEDAKNINCNLSQWLLRLRQACSHAVVATGNNSFSSGLGNAFGGDVAALTLDQVLTQLVDEADLEVWTRLRDKYHAQLQLGQLYDVSYQMPRALKEWHAVVAEIKEQLAKDEPRIDELVAEVKASQLQVEEFENKVGKDNEYDDDDEEEVEDEDTGHEDAHEETKSMPNETEDIVQSSKEESEDDRVQRLQDNARLFDAKRSLAIANNRLKSLRIRCKSLWELLHRAYFYLGTGYFRSSKRIRLGASKEEYESAETQAVVRDNYAKEIEYYNLAEEVRNQILSEAGERVNDLTQKLRPLKLGKYYRLCSVPKARIADELAKFADDTFRHLQELLTQPLLEEAKQQGPIEKLDSSEVDAVISTANTNGATSTPEKPNKTSKSAASSQEQGEAAAPVETDAYGKTLDAQEYAFVYLELLQILLRDRAANINGGNIQPRPTTVVSENAQEKLTAELIDKREELVAMLHYDRVPLTNIFKASGVSDSVISQLKAEVKACQARYSSLRDLYNARVEYYRQLQELSDQVEDIDTGNKTDFEQLIAQKKHDISMAEYRVKHKLNNQTYLRNLEGHNHGDMQQRDESKPDPVKPGSGVGSSDGKGTQTPGNDDSKANGDASSEHEESKCTICLETIENGALTPCGHFFCEDCLMNWLLARQSCPLCNRQVTLGDVRKFRSGDVPLHSDDTVATPSDNPTATTNTSLPSGSQEDYDASHASDLYVSISNKLYNRIHRMEITRMYGIKIDMIVKHAKYLRSQDPTAQIVVFSQWGTMLKVLHTAFAENRVLVASTYDSDVDVNAFRTNPDVACLLLHAKADVAGLTLVNANHVFLCEPLMNTALELQAVSRINRIGQLRETTVWQFCIEDTVEQTILGITTKDRLLQTTVNNQEEEEPDDSKAMDEASTQGMLVDRRSGAEIIGDTNYLKRILFKNSQSHTNRTK